MVGQRNIWLAISEDFTDGKSWFGAGWANCILCDIGHCGSGDELIVWRGDKEQGEEQPIYIHAHELSSHIFYS